jgi:isopentenyl-diphosphate delta-isomerase
LEWVAEIESRKTDHIELAARGDVAFHTTTLLECVRLSHCAVPELNFELIDTTVTLLGKRLSAPILVAGMTGGTEHAQRINFTLAELAEELGLGFGLGSQRPMLGSPNQRGSYDVRKVAPGCLLLGNIGAVQAAALSTQRIVDELLSIGVDALCVHLNPAMELVQPGGDRDFRGVLDTLQRLVEELPVPVIAKETGCGISLAAARRLRERGVEHVDVSGAGGTSWVAVETHRAEGGQKALGELFWDWGVPTAASVVAARQSDFRTIFATGGIKNGLEAAKALVLGAHAAGIARPVLQSLEAGGREGARHFLKQVELELRTAMLLVGAGTVRDLARIEPLLTGELAHWCRGMQPAPDRAW